MSAAEGTVDPKPPVAKGSGGAERQDGLGKISDALDAFKDAALKLPAEPAPDANVTTAFTVGWAVADAQMWTEVGTPRQLAPSVPGSVSDSQRWNVLMGQIAAGCQRLHTHLKGVAAPNLDLSDAASDWLTMRRSADTPEPSPSTADVKAKLAGLGDDLITQLWSTEQYLGQAYALGQSMQDMCSRPAAGGQDRSAVGRSIELHAENVHALLTALASRLPANAAHGTDNSLRLWRAAMLTGKAPEADVLLRQGWSWRSVLAGGVAARDLLRMSDYVGAAEGVASRSAEAVRHALLKLGVWVAIVLVLFLAGVALLVWVSIAAGAATVLAALGLTWKGVGELLGRVAAKAEGTLWDAELDWAIAYRFTVLPAVPDTKEARQVKELADDPQTIRHVARFKEWNERWPDTDRLMRSADAATRG